ncbi:hypothetical protein EWM64_g2982 [Hericium alpestre]|uniref:F-box domain-containing protein n=1 Tax=Hericium alpestre TaxID=135208 RepID=A0A4Z0A1U6_9AGAM|nr:hypothetical protein EWM64_g2982 [Hericium alpestre]
MLMFNGSRLPRELIRPIIELVDRDFEDDVHEMAEVCWAWRYEVESYIYSSVDVPDTKLLFFARTLVDRPDLARRVRRLALTPAGHRPKQPGDIDIVARMFKLLVNMKDLSIIEGPHFQPLEWVISPVADVWIIENCPFSLVRFKSFFAWTPRHVDFLATQPDLREFLLEGGSYAEDIPMIPDTALSHCTSLRADPRLLLGLQVPRAITHLRVDLFHMSEDEELEAAHSIAFLGNQLRSLCINRWIKPDEEPYARTSDMLRIFAPKTSHLSFLGLYEAHDYSRPENARIRRLISRHLRKLKAFVWGPLYVSRYADEDFSSDGSGFSINTDDDDIENSEVKTTKYVMAMMKSSPMLDVFISKRSGSNSAWVRRRSDGSIRSMSLAHSMTEDSFRFVDPDDPLNFIVNGEVHSAFKPEKYVYFGLPLRRRQIMD